MKLQDDEFNPNCGNCLTPMKLVESYENISFRYKTRITKEFYECPMCGNRSFASSSEGVP